jgi:glutathione S-transferase
MSYILYGSKTSPYVRKLQILMEKLPYEFREVDIYDQHRELFKQVNPIQQIPVLIDGDLTIWDSRQIFNYLNMRYRFQNIDWNDENLLSVIDGLLTAGVNLVLLRKSGLDISSSNMFFERQRDKIESILDYLRPYIKGSALQEWNFHSISLYCFLDWALFREIISLEHRPECRDFLNQHAERAIVKQTQLPKG